MHDEVFTRPMSRHSNNRINLAFWIQLMFCYYADHMTCSGSQHIKDNLSYY